VPIDESEIELLGAPVAAGDVLGDARELSVALAVSVGGPARVVVACADEDADSLALAVSHTLTVAFDDVDSVARGDAVADGVKVTVPVAVAVAVAVDVAAAEAFAVAVAIAVDVAAAEAVAVAVAVAVALAEAVSVAVALAEAVSVLVVADDGVGPRLVGPTTTEKSASAAHARSRGAIRGRAGAVGARRCARCGGWGARRSRPRRCAGRRRLRANDLSWRAPRCGLSLSQSDFC
jgi:hypothetical protein